MVTPASELTRCFDPSLIDPETTAFNAALQKMPPLPGDIVAIREMVAAQMAAASPDGKIYQSPRAEEIPVPGSGARLRLIRPERSAAVGTCLHVHGGGWSFGGAGDHDHDLEALADELGVLAASVDYRLAPESPYPAGLDDVHAAIRYLTNSATASDPANLAPGGLVVMGDSAGANLALSATLRLRDDGDVLPAALVLLYGAYDLTVSPSQRQFGDAGMVNSRTLPYFYSLYASSQDVRNPEISPLYGRLKGLPKSLLLVGTDDPLLDDSLFLYMRMVAAQVDVSIHIAPGGMHGFNYFQIGIGQEAVSLVRRYIRAST